MLGDAEQRHFAARELEPLELTTDETGDSAGRDALVSIACAAESWRRSSATRYPPVLSVRGGGQIRHEVGDTATRQHRGLGQALTIREVVLRQNYGQAQELSSMLFDNVRKEADATPSDVARGALDEVLARDIR
jgi:hypothetical protein